MNAVVTRRTAMLGVASLSLLGSQASKTIARLAPPAARDHIQAMEARNGGRLGVLVVDTATGAFIENRADERFPLRASNSLIVSSNTPKPTLNRPTRR